jgi:uncharacterized protein YkwD
MPKKKRSRPKPRPSARHVLSTAPAGSAWVPEPWGDDVEPARPSFDLASRLVGGDGQRKRLEDHVASLANDARARAGLPKLKTDERLRQSAREHGADMAARGFFAHESPEGETAFDRMLRAGYPHGAAENIARGQRKPHEVIHAWMNSPGHRWNILHPDFVTIGVGVHLGEPGPWWVQHFGY